MFCHLYIQRVKDAQGVPVGTIHRSVHVFSFSGVVVVNTICVAVGAGGKSLVDDLTTKYAEKPWKETFQLVRRCMGRSNPDPKSSKLLSGCLQRLQKALNVSSLSTMVSRLEIIAKQRGLGSHLSPTETACYLTADLFYLEVLLKPDGGVEDVKVALHGEPPLSSALLLQLLSMTCICLSRQKKFEDFSAKLCDLSSLYNIPGDNDAKIKVCTALQFMEKDLVTISHLPRSLRENDVYIDTVLNGRVGKIVPSGPGTPMKIQYSISPSDMLLQRHGADIEGLTRDAFVMLGSRGSTHRLQLASLIPSPPQTDALGFPLFSPITEVASESLQACFTLKLKPPLAICSSVIRRMEQTTDVKPEADQQRVPLLQLLMRTTLGEQGFQESWDPGEEANFTVALPGASYDLYCEVLPVSDSSVSVTFFLPGTSSLAVLLVTVMHLCQVRCQLFAPLLVDAAMNDYISRVTTRCMSIPITMRAIYKSLTSPLFSDASGTTTAPGVCTSPHEVNTAASSMVHHSLHPAPDLHAGSSEMESTTGEFLGPTPQNSAQEEEEEEEEEDPAAMYTSPSCYVMSVSSPQEVREVPASPPT
ncbi:mediator of RNA polymerase II transcription subunit 1-like isoform X3 [Clupea harengus]|uniref:Mediator of RNA polymerase II transcription subunit 1 n=1 Tax=Clupea harengus TaxID=7950 RepID=A0A6P8GL37_CLUHA|nr:mediator of RNA polymerase II transcription subunit 1-like isoform X3 [Clupea harengus]